MGKLAVCRVVICRLCYQTGFDDYRANMLLLMTASAPSPLAPVARAHGHLVINQFTSVVSLTQALFFDQKSIRC